MSRVDLKWMVIKMHEKLVKVLDSFQYALNDCTGNNKYVIFDDHVALANHLISNGVIVQKHGYWINTPPYRASNGNYNKAQECSVCHALFVSSGNTPYSNHPYCCECGAKMDGDENV